MSEQTRSILKNATSYMVSSVIEGILGFVITLIIARYLYDVGLGQYSFAFSFVMVFAIFADVGLEALMVREIARKKSRTQRYLNAVLTLKIVLGIVFIIIVPLLIFFMTKKDVALLPVVCLASLALFFDRLRYVFNAVFVAHERVELSLFVGVIERTTALILVFILIRLWGLLGVGLALMCSYFVSYLVSSYLTKKNFVSYSFTIDIPFWKKLLRHSWPFWFSSLFMIIYYKTDTLMLSYLRGYDEVGWYNAAYTLVFALTFIPSAVITAVYPVMSKYYTNSSLTLSSSKLLKDLFHNCFRYLVLLAVPIIGGTLFLAQRIIPFIYNEQFQQSILVLQILVLTTFFLFVNYLIGYLFNAIHKQTYFTTTTGICALFNVVLNFFLIPQWGAYGAATATVITETINFIMLSSFCRQWHYAVNLFKLLWKPLIAVSGMLMAGYALFSLPLLVLICIEAVVYFVLLILLKEVGQKEWLLIKVLFKIK